jgi:hypothetical protein
VSESYQYDRIVDRDKPKASRKKRPWEVAGAAVAKTVKKTRG